MTYGYQIYIVYIQDSHDSMHMLGTPKKAASKTPGKRRATNGG